MVMELTPKDIEFDILGKVKGGKCKGTLDKISKLQVTFQMKPTVINNNGTWKKLAW